MKCLIPTAVLIVALIVAGMAWIDFTKGKYVQSTNRYQETFNKSFKAKVIRTIVHNGSPILIVQKADGNRFMISPDWVENYIPLRPITIQPLKKDHMVRVNLNWKPQAESVFDGTVIKVEERTSVEDLVTILREDGKIVQIDRSFVQKL